MRDACEVSVQNADRISCAVQLNLHVLMAYVKELKRSLDKARMDVGYDSESGEMRVNGDDYFKEASTAICQLGRLNVTMHNDLQQTLMELCERGVCGKFDEMRDSVRGTCVLCRDEERELCWLRRDKVEGSCSCTEPNICLTCAIQLLFANRKEEARCPFCTNTFTRTDLRIAQHPK